MTRYARAKLILLWVFILAYAALVAVVHHELQGYARQEAERRLLDTLLVHKAVHGFVMRTLRPEVFRLQREGLLAPEYFSPKLMSFTYIARQIQAHLNDERRSHGAGEVYFKLASDNPRNPINRADAAEHELLRRMDEGRLGEYREIVEREGRRYLYAALPVERTDKSCMRCHGDPGDAPAELLRQYGDRAGFGEHTGAVRALISLRVPLAPVEARAREILAIFAAAALSVMATIYALIAFFLGRLEAQQRIIVEKNALLDHLSTTDPLTDVYNRRGFSRRLDEELGRVRRSGEPVALVMFDIDHFKRINDEHGHAAGDEVLVRLAETVRRNIRVSDVLGRWGGEEFLLLLPQEDADAAAGLAEKLRAQIAAQELVAGIALTISLGVAQYRPFDTAEALINRADRALYLAKQGGRNRTAVEGD